MGTSNKKDSTSLRSYVARMWNNRIIRALCYLTGVLTARKILDIVRRKWYKLPPGPIGVPFFGIFHQFANEVVIRSYANYYGPVYMTHFGFTQICFMNDYNLLSKYFSKKEWSDRKEKLTSYEKPFGIITNHGSEWHTRRKLMKNNVISPLNSQLLTKIIIDTMDKYVFPMIDDCIDISADIDSNQNGINTGKMGGKNVTKKTWDIRKECNYIAFCSIFSSIFGNDVIELSPFDDTFIEYNDITTKGFSLLALEFVTFFLLPQKIHYFISPMIGFGRSTLERYSIIRKWINMYESKVDNGDIKTTSKGTFYEAVKESKLKLSTGIADMQLAFSAGMHTTAIAMEQCILYLAYCGFEYQDKLYNELKNENCIKYNDNDNGDADGDDNCNNINIVNVLKCRNKLHLLSSFIYEVLRIHGLIELSLPRCLRSKDEIIELENGIKYALPKNTVIIGNIDVINKKWLKFDQTRFLVDKDNKEDKPMFVGTKQASKQMITFGMGKRNCAGQELAIKELYLVVAMLFEKYRFDIPDTFKSRKEFFDNIPKKFGGVNTKKIGVKPIHRTKCGKKSNLIN